MQAVSFIANHRPSLWLKPRCLYLPLDTSFPLLDAFMFAPPKASAEGVASRAATIVAFQMTFADSIDAKHKPTEGAFDCFVDMFNNANLFAEPDGAKPVKLVAEPGRVLRVAIDCDIVPLNMSMVFCTRSANLGYQSMVGSASRPWQASRFAWDQVRQYRLDVSSGTP
jgi:hypothetical protein